LFSGLFYRYCRKREHFWLNPLVCALTKAPFGHLFEIETLSRHNGFRNSGMPYKNAGMTACRQKRIKKVNIRAKYAKNMHEGQDRV
jgi:hypothetical protein